MKSGIYSIRNTKTGHIYVGSAINIDRRWYVHRSDLRGGYHRNSHLQRAWNKYGEECFDFAVIEYVAIEELLDREQYWIDKLEATAPEKGYNMSTLAGAPMQGRKHSLVTLEKMRKAQAGKKLSEETKRKISERAQGRILSAEHKTKISAGMKGKQMPPRTEEWKRQQSERAKSHVATEEQREKTRASVRAHHMSEASHMTKTYIVTTPEGEELVIRNLDAFCRDHGLSISSMRKTSWGITHQHKGWYCRILEP